MFIADNGTEGLRYFDLRSSKYDWRLLLNITLEVLCSIIANSATILISMLFYWRPPSPYYMGR